MAHLSDEIRERVYAGVLGKLIGVYLGRAVEGWSYEAIRERFGTIANYVYHEVGMPLIVPDDDLSGTFVFFRALEDHGYDPALSARRIGETWLNYIIEDKTILWWGGMSRSTEHTAWLRLSQGHAAPASGSIALNGRAMAEQIGAQIFIDGWALANPGAPERAARLARAAASVSHDGIAVDCAEFLAVLEALAFCEADAGRLLERGLGLVGNRELRGLVAAVRERCAAAGHWREVRDWIEREHGYHRYPGNCPMVTNHLSVLMALLLGGDDFGRSLSIAASAGWDTDCNAGNVGCLNGVRLGLAALSAGVDLRAPVADRLFAVSADGGECITDAVLETRRILRAAAALRGEEEPARQPRFGFEFPGAVQGFQVDREPRHLQAVTGLRNVGAGLVIAYERLAPGRCGRLRVQTCFAPEPSGVRDTSYFEVLASPTLYGTQTVHALVQCGAGPQPSWRFFVRHYRGDGSLHTRYGEPTALQPGANTAALAGAGLRRAADLRTGHRADRRAAARRRAHPAPPRLARRAGVLRDGAGRRAVTRSDPLDHQYAVAEGVPQLGPQPGARLHHHVLDLASGRQRRAHHRHTRLGRLHRKFGADPGAPAHGRAGGAGARPPPLLRRRAVRRRGPAGKAPRRRGAGAGALSLRGAAGSAAAGGPDRGGR